MSDTNRIGTGDERSIGESVGLLIRHSWLIIGVAVVCTVAGLALAPGATQPRAEGTVGLSDAVNWPYFLQTREHYVAVASDLDIEGQVAQTVAGVSSVTVDAADGDETRIIVAATADSSDAAIAAVDEASALLVAASDGEVNTETQRQRDALATDIAEMGERLGELERDLVEATRAEAEAQLRVDQRLDSFEDDFVALRSSQQRRANVATEISVITRNRSEMEVDLDDLDRQLVAGEAELVVVAPAAASQIDGQSPIVVGALAGLVGAFLAAVAVTIFLGGRQRVSADLLDQRYPTTTILSAEDTRVLPATAAAWDRIIDGHDDVVLLRTKSATGADAHWLKAPPDDECVGTEQASEAVSRSRRAVLAVTRADTIGDVDDAVHAIRASGVDLDAIAVIGS